MFFSLWLSRLLWGNRSNYTPSTGTDYTNCDIYDDEEPSCMIDNTDDWWCTTDDDSWSDSFDDD
jgi:hypothetical protein